MNEDNNVMFHDFVHPERHYDQLESAIEEAAIKISAQEAYVLIVATAQFYDD